ncbi:HNH endonuclease [Allokutzneria sp. A3M-2-11 16]|uniref:HNH endonuclease signature motif containing protein n=1 Tax=Allokutzneria sp. A3M-2-11 16 TaxID=2962043 RepID=UPI0020B86F2B|nr:HNH endonuclease signature motif containing protein [Allokutzneria sp. A3M-2-11 16]MCP3798406.1 HNH endonuclease [Allokutzneria sp. A3M-2-11 16]
METLTNMVTAAATDGAAEAESQGMHSDYGCKDLAVLLRVKLKLDSGEAGQRARLVRELPSLPRTQALLREGKISGRRALIISGTVGKVPAEKAGKAEDVLCQHAPRLNPRQLTYAGKVLRSRIDPEGVHRDEQEGYARRYLRMGTNEHGYLMIKAAFDPITGAKIKTVLHALAKPRPVGGEKDPRTTEQRYADAFAEVIAIAMASQDLPTCGEERPRVVVTMSWDNLHEWTGAGYTQWDDPTSAGSVRLVACDAEVMPVVLGGESLPLDVGRSRRLATVTQRRALAVRDKGCAFPGCDRPPAWTEAHHVVHWIDGGPTDLGNLVLLCSHHHHVVHQGDWEIVFEHGIPTFIPPRWVDPDQQPMRNIRVGHLKL